METLIRARWLAQGFTEVFWKRALRARGKPEGFFFLGKEKTGEGEIVVPSATLTYSPAFTETFMQYIHGTKENCIVGCV